MLLPLQINLAKPPAPPPPPTVHVRAGGIAYLYQWGTCYALEMHGQIYKNSYVALLRMAHPAGAIVKELD
jgi:hypothetical protein